MSDPWTGAGKGVSHADRSEIRSHLSQWLRQQFAAQQERIEELESELIGSCVIIFGIAPKYWWDSIRDFQSVPAQR